MANTTIPSELIQASVALGGSPTTTTQSASDNTTKIATTAYVTAAVNSLIDSAPGTMNTLNEIAAALNDDASFNTTVTNAIATKLPLGGGTMTGNLIVNASLDISGDIDVDGTTNLDVVDIDGAVDMASSLTMSAGGTISAGGANDLVLNAGASGTPDIYLQSGGATKVKIEGSDNTVTIGLNNSSSSNLTLYGATSAESQIFFGNDGTNGNKDGAIRYFHEAHGTTANRRSMTFSTANSERMRIGSTGKITTRGTTASGYNVLEFGTININTNLADGVVDFAQGLAFTNNVTNEGAWTQAGICTTGSSGYNGNLVFGTDGNSSRTSNTITERMRIDSSGDVLIGQTSQTGYAFAQKLVVGDGDNNDGITIQSGGTHQGNLAFNHSDGTTAHGRISYQHQTNYMQFFVNNSEKVKIDSAGTTSLFRAGTGMLPTLVLKNANTSVGDGAKINFTSGTSTEGAGIAGRGTALNKADLVFFAGGNTERMRILSDGDVCIGKPSNDINTAGWHVISSGTYTGTVYSGITGSTASTTYHLRDTTNNAWKFYVENSGTVKATVTSIAGLSDERLKENIKDLETGLTEVMSLKPRRFDWKEGEGSNKKNVAGFVAQEVETVLPDVIEGFMHDDLDDAKSVRMGDMLPTLVKAIQEQQTLIETLTARIETLEG